MITDRIGLHSVLLPLLIVSSTCCFATWNDATFWQVHTEIPNPPFIFILWHAFYTTCELQLVTRAHTHPSFSPHSIHPSFQLDPFVESVGVYHLTKKSRNFRFEVKWKGNFPENLFGNCGQPPEVLHFFRLEWQSGNLEIVPFSGPFSQNRVNMRDGMPGGKWLAPFLSGWSINSKNRLPLCNDHSIRIIWRNGNHHDLKPYRTTF